MTDHNGVLSIFAKDVPLGSYAQDSVSTSFEGTLAGLIFAESVPSASIIQKGHAFKYATPKGATGVTRLLVKESRTPGLFRVKVKTRGAWSPGSVFEAPGLLYVQLNVGGKCFFGHPTRVRQ